MTSALKAEKDRVAGTGMGQPLLRKEDQRLLTGAGSYGDDQAVAGQLYAVMLRSPHAHASIISIDSRAAKAAEGVLEVLTYADYVAAGLKSFPLRPRAMTPPDIDLQNVNGQPVYLPSFFPLAADRARFVGEGVAWIVATSVNAAKSASELVDIEYEALPAATDGRAAAEAGAEVLWPEMDSNVVLDAQVGPLDAVTGAFANARHVVRLETFVPRVTGVPMEPRTALATVDSATGKLTLHAGGGSVTRPKDALMHMLGLPEELVRVVANDVGGNFGTRNYPYAEFILAAWSALRIGRPVKWTCERTESFMSDYAGRDLAVTAELALDKHGNFLALRSSNLSNVGAYPVSFIPLTKGTELMSSLYHIPVAHARARGVYTNSSPTAPYRSAGRPEVMFVMERLIDIAAGQFGFDRVEIRRQNLIPLRAMPYTNPYGMNYDSGDYLKIFIQALATADIDGFSARKSISRKSGRKRGLGFGCYIESASGYPHERATITVHTDDRVSVVIGTLSAGQGHETSFAQVVTEALGVSFDTVRIVAGDTDAVKVGGGSHSGRSMRHAATTISRGAAEIVDKATRVAALMLQVPPESVIFEAGHFKTASSGHSLHLFEIARAMSHNAELPTDLGGALTATADVNSVVASFPYGAHVSEVEIDVETGEVFLVRYTAVDDVGRAVNPMILHGQAHGGIAQSVGEALMEECTYDESGQLTTGSFMDYAMPRASDLPWLETAISEVPSTTHPHGLRGGGEGGATPTLGVIANAIVDALSEYDVDHIELPATSEKVWSVIGRCADRGIS
jgi:carbon-monoxide dehydrogenase large subunit